MPQQKRTLRSQIISSSMTLEGPKEQTLFMQYRMPLCVFVSGSVRVAWQARAAQADDEEEEEEEEEAKTQKRRGRRGRGGVCQGESDFQTQIEGGGLNSITLPLCACCLSILEIWDERLNLRRASSPLQFWAQKGVHQKGRCCMTPCSSPLQPRRPFST